MLESFRMRSKIVLLTVALSLCAYSQDTSQTPQRKIASLPTIRFVFDHPELPVTHYQIDTDSTGVSHYESRIKGQEKGTSDEGSPRDFTLSASTRDRIFALVKEANNLFGNY